MGKRELPGMHKVQVVVKKVKGRGGYTPGLLVGVSAVSWGEVFRSYLATHALGQMVP